MRLWNIWSLRNQQWLLYIYGGRRRRKNKLQVPVSRNILWSMETAAFRRWSSPRRIQLMTPIVKAHVMMITLQCLRASSKCLTIVHCNFFFLGDEFLNEDRSFSFDHNGIPCCVKTQIVFVLQIFEWLLKIIYFQS